MWLLLSSVALLASARILPTSCVVSSSFRVVARLHPLHLSIAAADQDKMSKSDAPAAAVITAEARQQAISRGRAALELLPAKGGLPSDYVQALRAFAEGGAPDLCIGILRRMGQDGLTPSLESYAFVVSALQAAGRGREASRWMRRIVQPEISSALINRKVAEGRLVDREAYNRVLASYSAAGRPAEAISTMRQMVSQGGVTPDIVSFNCAPALAQRRPTNRSLSSATCTNRARIISAPSAGPHPQREARSPHV